MKLNDPIRIISYMPVSCEWVQDTNKEHVISENSSLREPFNKLREDILYQIKEQLDLNKSFIINNESDLQLECYINLIVNDELVQLVSFIPVTQEWLEEGQKQNSSESINDILIELKTDLLTQISEFIIPENKLFQVIDLDNPKLECYIDIQTIDFSE